MSFVRPTKGAISLHDGISSPFFCFSNAHCCLAPSSWRRLLRHELTLEVVRARKRDGIAIHTTAKKQIQRIHPIPVIITLALRDISSFEESTARATCLRGSVQGRHSNCL